MGSCIRCCSTVLVQGYLITRASRLAPERPAVMPSLSLSLSRRAFFLNRDNVSQPLSRLMDPDHFSLRLPRYALTLYSSTISARHVVTFDSIASLGLKTPLP